MSNNAKVEYIQPSKLEIRHTGNIQGNTERLPYLATVIKNQRQAHQDMLLFDTGGFSGPNKLGPHKGLVQVEVLNHVQCQATVPGRAEAMDTSALKAMAKLANFPFLASNWRGMGEDYFFSRRLLLKHNGLDVVVLGMAWPESPKDTETIAPETALDEALADLDTQQIVVIILSQLDYSVARTLAMHGPATKVIIEGISYPGFNATTKAGNSLLVPASPDFNNLGALSLDLSGALKINKAAE